MSALRSLEKHKNFQYRISGYEFVTSLVLSAVKYQQNAYIWLICCNNQCRLLKHTDHLVDTCGDQ